MKFDYVIGNPPYQEETDSDSTCMPPVYNLFMDESYKVAHKVELITPARFLFNAGYTPKSWNEKILNDEHFKVLMYEVDSAKFFPNIDGEYQKARWDMQEIVTIKANIDTLKGYTEPGRKQEKER